MHGGSGVCSFAGRVPTTQHLLAWYLTASDIAPRCTGRWGALATRDPSGPNRAHEKSRRSLMLTLTLVRCRTRPICSAMPMKRCENTASCTGSASARVAGGVGRAGGGPPGEPPPRSMRTSPADVTTAVAPGSTTMVEISLITSAGPGRACPGTRAASKKTGVAWRPPTSKQASTIRSGAGGGGGPSGAGGGEGGEGARPTARTRASSTATPLPTSTNPNSRLYASSKAASTAAALAPTGQGVMTATSVPS